MLLFIALQNDACLLWPIEEINANVPTNERNIYNVIIGMNLGILSREVEVYKEIAVNEKYEKTCQLFGDQTCKPTSCQARGVS